MEIERKFLIHSLPADLEQYPFLSLEQGYLCTDPVVRIRKEDEHYYMTYKSDGLMAREEYNLPLTKEAYEHLRTKVDHSLITKRRYRIPYQKWVIELDLFEGHLDSLILAEVEFTSTEEADSFTGPDWFAEDVTYLGLYHNNYLCQHTREELEAQNIL